MCTNLAFILSAVLLAFLGFYLNLPLHEGFQERWLLKTFLAGFKAGNLMATVGSSLGYDSSLNISRKTVGTLFAWTSRPVSSDGLEIRDVSIENVPVRIYRPKEIKQTLSPIMVYYHGGGMVTFSLDTYENVLRQMSKELDITIISVGYRLAPEHKFPAAIDDCYTVTEHVLKQAHLYGGDGARVAIAGDSAGGNLAAAVSSRLAYSSSSLAQPKLQVLIYPMMQAIDFQVPSYIKENNEIASGGAIAGAWYMYCTGKSEPPVADMLANYHTSYELKKSKYGKFADVSLIRHPKYRAERVDTLNKLYNEDLARELEPCVTDPLFSPLMANDLSNLPKTYILSAEFDILRDESFMYETRLKSAGVDVTHEHVFGVWHGVMSYTRTSAGRDALQKVIRFIRHNL